MELKGSKTEANLWAAFAGESQARNKYDYFAGVAKKEGYEQIAGVFALTALNEKEHAKLWFKQLQGISDTRTNLQHAAEGEHYEWDEMYKEFAAVAKEEGFTEIARLFESVADVESEHENRYKKLMKNIDDDLVFNAPQGTVWVCRNCGHVHIGDKAPEICPTCAHPKAYFERQAQNF
jgi:rubrerythrin